MAPLPYRLFFTRLFIWHKELFLDGLPKRIYSADWSDSFTGRYHQPEAVVGQVLAVESGHSLEWHNDF